MIKFIVPRRMIFLVTALFASDFSFLLCMEKPGLTKDQANKWLIEQCKLPTATEHGIHAAIIAGADIDAEDGEQKTALHWLIENNREDLVQWLINRGANVNNRFFRKNLIPPIVLAAGTGNIAIVRLLIEKGAPIQDTHGTVFDITYDTLPLQMAALAGHADMVSFLLERGAKVNSRGRGPLNTPLCEAAEAGHVQVVCILLDHLADIQGRASWRTAETVKWWNPITWGEAPIEGLVDLFDGACDRLNEDRLRTPFQHALVKGHVEVARLLLERGATAASPDMEKFQELQRQHKDKIDSALELVIRAYSCNPEVCIIRDALQGQRINQMRACEYLQSLILQAGIDENLRENCMLLNNHLKAYMLTHK